MAYIGQLRVQDPFGIVDHDDAALVLTFFFVIVADDEPVVHAELGTILQHVTSVEGGLLAWEACGVRHSFKFASSRAFREVADVFEAMRRAQQLSDLQDEVLKGSVDPGLIRSLASESTSDGEGEEEVRQALALLHVLSGADGPAVDAALLPGPEQERRVPNSEVVLNVSSATCHLCKRERSGCFVQCPLEFQSHALCEACVAECTGLSASDVASSADEWECLVCSMRCPCDRCRAERARRPLEAYAHAVRSLATGPPTGVPKELPEDVAEALSDDWLPVEGGTAASGAAVPALASRQPSKRRRADAAAEQAGWEQAGAEQAAAAAGSEEVPASGGVVWTAGTVVQAIRDQVSTLRSGRRPEGPLPGYTPEGSVASQELYRLYVTGLLDEEAAEEAEAGDGESECVCFICKEGGDLVMCDYRSQDASATAPCRKVYHMQCVGSDSSSDEWLCPRHACSFCHSPAAYRCRFCFMGACKAHLPIDVRRSRRREPDDPKITSIVCHACELRLRLLGLWAKVK